MVDTAKVRLCGAISVELDGERVEGAMPGRQGRLLFAYLLCERARGVSRDELAALLWPAGPPRSAGVTLRALLSKLRSVVRPGVLVGIEQLQIELGSGVWVDVEAAVEAVRHADEALRGGTLRRACDCARTASEITSRRFLPGETGDWVELKRRELEDLHLVALEQLGRASLELGGSELVVAEECGQAIVAAAPYRETGHLLLMRAAVARGNRAEALAGYERARVLLRDELGIPPTRELRSLHEQLLRDEPDDEAITSTDLGMALECRAQIALPAALLSARRTPLVGRTADLARLVSQFEVALRTGPSLVALCGDAGIGKTRLIGDFAAVLANRRLVILYGRASGDSATAYEPFLQALGYYIASASGAELSKFREIDPPVLGVLLPELYGSSAVQAAPPSIDEHNGRRRAFVALTRILELVAGTCPVVLALDDMQWADAASLELLNHLVSSIRAVPIMMLLAYRESEATLGIRRVLETTQRYSPVERVDLSPLSEEEVELLISAWAGSGAPASLTRRLYNRTEGNPLFIGHLLRHLVRAGAIDSQKRRWASEADIESLGIPREIDELIDLRLAPLGSRALAVLRVGAVTGDEFSVDLVERVIRDHDDSTLDALEAAVAAGLLVEDPDRPRSFRFAHALLRESIYSRLTQVRRARLHYAVGEAIESLRAEDLDKHSAELAGHFLAAARGGEDPRRAITAALAAAEQARAVFANEQAEFYYRSAIDLLEQQPERRQRLQAYEGLGDMLAIRTKYQLAVDAYVEGLVSVPDRCVERARLERKIGRAQTRARNAEAATEAFGRAEAAIKPLSDEDGTNSELIEITLDRCTLLYWQSNTTEMGRVLRRMRPLVTQHATPNQHVRFLNSMLAREARMRCYRLTAKSVELARQALSAGESAGDPAAIAYCQFQLGFSLLWAEQPDRGTSQLELAAELARRAGDLMLQSRALAYLGVAHRQERRTEATERTADSALKAAEAANAPEYQAISHANLAWVGAQRAQSQLARAHAQRALDLMAAFPFQLPMFLALPLWPLIATALAEDDLASATEYAHRLLDPRLRPMPAPIRNRLQSAIDCDLTDPSTATANLVRATRLADGLTTTL